MPKIDKHSALRTHLVSAFSLIELIIVILIASLFAALVFNNVNLSTKKEKKVGIQELKKAAGMIIKDTELVCIDKCSRCSLVSNGKSTDVNSQLKELKAYILDDGGDPQEIDFGRAKDKKVCLRFHYYPNGSNSQMIIESDEKYYFIPSFFGDVAVYDDMDSAVSRWLRYRNQLDSMGTFY